MKTIVSIIAILFLNITNSTAQTIESQLGEAASSGNLKKVKQLVEKKGANVNAVLQINGEIQIPLIVKVVMEKKSEIAIYLIEKGANVNAQDGFGMTSLMWASYNGDVELVKLLLEKGADKTVEVKGQTALSAAEEKGFTEIIELLK
jgi:ankyrin repeat protein